MSLISATYSPADLHLLYSLVSEGLDQFKQRLDEQMKENVFHLLRIPYGASKSEEFEKKENSNINVRVGSCSSWISTPENTFKLARKKVSRLLQRLQQSAKTSNLGWLKIGLPFGRVHVVVPHSHCKKNRFKLFVFWCVFNRSQITRTQPKFDQTPRRSYLGN